MFPAIGPWPMTLAPTNEAVRREPCGKKPLFRKKTNRHDREVMEDVRTVLPSIRVRFCESGRLNFSYF